MCDAKLIKWTEFVEPTYDKLDQHRILLTFLDLRGADLSDTYLYGQCLRGADLSHANLHNTNLRTANLNNANLNSANLSDSELVSAQFGGANLAKANLSGADLWDTDCRGANLRDANLIGAKLSGANFTGANLSGTKFVGSIFKSILAAGLINLSLGIIGITLSLSILASIWPALAIGGGITVIRCAWHYADRSRLFQRIKTHFTHNNSTYHLVKPS